MVLVLVLATSPSAEEWGGAEDGWEGERDSAFESSDSLWEKIRFDLRDRVSVEFVSGQEITA